MNLGLTLLLGSLRASGGGGTITGLTLTSTKVGVDEAPQNVHFVATALGVSDPADVVVWWDFDDTYEFRYLPETTQANDRQSGTAIGHRAAHVYRTAGAYTATATAYQFVGGTIISVSGTVEVVIAAADANITQTIAISKTGSFTGAPVGHVPVDWSGGIPASYTLPSNSRVLFEAGQTFEFASATTDALAAAPNTNGSIKVGKWGVGPNPTIKVPQGVNCYRPLSRVGKQTFDSVNFDAGWRATNNPDWEDTGVYPTPPPEPGTCLTFATGNIENETANYLVFGCSLRGGSINFYPSQGKFAFVDSESTEWWNFGAFGDAAQEGAVVGCYIHQSLDLTDLPIGGFLGDRGWNSTGFLNTPRHGPLRIAVSFNAAVNKSVLFTYRNGWSISTEPGGIAFIQPALRMGTVTSSVDGAKNFSVSQNDFIGGATSVPTNTGPVEAEAASGVAVFESNYYTPNDGRTIDFTDINLPNAQLRNNVFYWPLSETTYANEITWVANSGGSTTSTLPVKVYSNTLVFDGDLPTKPWDTTLLGSGDVDFQYENNIVQMNGAFDASGSSAVFQTNYAPLEADFPYLPKFGSIAYGGYESGRLSPLTFYGVERTAPFSFGAGEESLEPVVTVAINEAEIFGGDVLGTDVTETGTIVFASTPTLVPGDISYNWLVNGIERADGYVIAGTDVVQARASFTHATGAQVILSEPLTAQQGAVAAPVLTGSPALLASWDFNNPSTVTEVSGAVSAIAGSDGTSVTLAQANAPQRPALATVGAYKVARFDRTASQFLQAANSLGNPAAMTIVLVAKSNTVTTGESFAALEVGTRTSAGTRGRVGINGIIIGGLVSNNGWQGTKSGTAGNSIATEGATLTTDLRLITVAAPSGTTPVSLFMDGTATPVTSGTSTPNATAYTHVTMGARAASNAESIFASADVNRALVYSGVLNATQLEEVAAWANTNYGTPNNA